MATGHGLETMQAVETLLRTNVEWAESQMRATGNLNSMAVVYGRSNSVVPIFGTMRTEEEKDGFFELLRLQAVADDAVAVLMMSEAWAVVGKVDPLVAPSRSPDRVEALVVALSARIADGTEIDLSDIRRIVRGEGGSVLSLEPVELPGDSLSLRLFGRLGSLLPPEAPTLETRRKARAEAQRMLKRIQKGKSARIPRTTIH